MNNGLGWVVVGIIGVLGLLVAYKVISEKKHVHDETCRPAQPAPAPQQPAPPVFVVPQQQPPVIVMPPQYPYHNPECHSSREFWAGYRDGYVGNFATSSNPNYLQGYKIGVHDRKLGRPYYYERYFNEPGSGFSLKLPGFRLDIR